MCTVHAQTPVCLASLGIPYEVQAEDNRDKASGATLLLQVTAPSDDCTRPIDKIEVTLAKARSEADEDLFFMQTNGQYTSSLQFLPPLIPFRNSSGIEGRCLEKANQPSASPIRVFHCVGAARRFRTRAPKSLLHLQVVGTGCSISHDHTTRYSCHSFIPPSFTSRRHAFRTPQ